MSGNQSRGDKSKPQHSRRTGRSGNPALPRNFTGGGKGSGGGGGGAAAPSSSASYSGKSFKKMVSNAQGAQAGGTVPNPNVNLGPLNSSTGGRAPQNGALPPPLGGTSDGSSTGSTINATDTFIQKSTPGLPKAPQSNAVPLSSGATGPSTPVKGPADAPTVFPLQFGSISTGLINGMQIDGQSSSISSSSAGVQDTASKNVLETSNKAEEPSIVADLSASPCDNDEKWNKGSGGPMGYLARGNHGVLSTPSGQPPRQYPGRMRSGSMQSPGPQMQSNNSDSERWPRTTGYQKGLMPSPHTPMMHKAERKYEGGKVTDDEQAKQRRFKIILYQLTPQNFEKLFDQVKQVNIDNADTLSAVVGQIFDMVMMEPTFAEMYANFCSRLAVELPGFVDDYERITFKRLLLNKCQVEFERGGREEEETNRTEEEGDIKLTEEEREEKRIKARRRMFGNIRLIGELYKKRMLTERIMHECIKKLLGFNKRNPNPDEEDIEALCKLMSTIGEMIDHPKAKEQMDAYFDMMFKFSTNMTLPSRVRFMLKHTIDLRRNKWKQRRKVEGPKKIEEVHRDAAQESLVQSSRLTREPSCNASLRRGAQPMDFGSSGSAGVLSSNPQMSGNFYGLPQHLCSYGSQDSRFDSFENRTFSVPLRPIGDELCINAQSVYVVKIDGQSSSVSSSSIGVQDTASKNLLETSNKVEEPSIVADLSASPCDNDEKWYKGSGGPMGPGWDPGLEMGYPARGNHGVLSTPCGQPPGQYPGGMRSGSMQSPGPQMQSNNSDSERWQHTTGYQKGLMLSPHTPMMHTAERKYKGGKVTDDEQAKQRRFKSILYQLTPQNFEKLFDQVKQINIDNADTLSAVVGQIFDMVMMEPTFTEMYANFCSRLAVELPGFGDDYKRITFKGLLLNKCQVEFEREGREEEETNRTEEEGDIKQTEEEREEKREEKRIKARRRMFGNIRLLGELYKKRMLTERIMHEIIKKLLGFNKRNPNPDEEDIEALCKLMSTIGEMIDHPKAKERMDAYFDMMFKFSNNMTLSSRVRFMLKHTNDLRRNKWQQRQKVEGPKKIEEVHRDAAQERRVQSSRLARGPNSNASLRRGAWPMDFGSRGSAGVLSSNHQMSGSFRGLPQQHLCSYGSQDSRFDSFENRTLSVPLRPIGDEPITLGPQGGLARGMSPRGQPAMQGIAGPNNGYGGSVIQERGGYGPSRDESASRYTPERFSSRPGYDPPNIQEHNMNFVNQDTKNVGCGGFDRVPPPERARVSTPPQSDPSDKIVRRLLA